MVDMWPRKKASGERKAKKNEASSLKRTSFGEGNCLGTLIL